jgi:hypothetical protein
MVDLWMPGADRHAVGNTGAMNGGPARAVWHITSNSRDWTFKNELGWFTGGGKDVAPHLLWDPFTGEIAQFFPANSRSLSLQNAGSVKTNRTGTYCIQIETVFTEGETVNGQRYNSVRETPCKNLDKIMAWLRSLGIADTWPGGAPAAFARDTVSMDTWTTRGGHFGHNQVPGNSHVDPGPMPNLFTTLDAPQEDDVPNTLGLYSTIDRPLVPGKWTTLTIDKTDLLTGATAYNATVMLTITSAPASGTFQGRFYHLRPDGSRWDAGIVERPATAGSSFVDFPHMGSIDDAEKLRFEIAYFPEGDDTKSCTITTARVRGLYWK